MGGSARRAAVLFGQCLSGVVEQQPPVREAVRMATFGDKPVWAAWPKTTRLWQAVSMSIQRAQAVDVDELRELVQLSLPFIVRDWMGQAWAARERWASLSYLHNVAGHRAVPVEVAGPAQENGKACCQVTMELAEFLQRFLAPSCWHCSSSAEPVDSSAEVACMNDHDLLEQCPELRADVPMASQKWREVVGRPKRTSVWLGTHGASTRLRSHEGNVSLTQVHGVRYATLFPPPARQCKRKQQTALKVVNLSDRDNIEQCSDFVETHTAELHPGDVLFIPRGWCYEVHSLSPACAVSSFF